MVQRIKDFAKKINFDVNDVISEAQNIGISGKSQSSSLTEEEASKILNAITLGKQISSIDDYLDGKIVIPSKKKPKKKAEKKAEPKEEAKAEVKAEVKDEAKAKTEADVKPEVKAEIKPEVKVEQKPQTAQKAEVKAEPKVEVKRASEINERAKNAMAPRGDKRDFRTDFKKPAQKNDTFAPSAQKP